MLLEETTIDKIEIFSSETISVRQKTSILKDGQEISCSFYRYTLVPGADLSEQPDRIKTIAEAIWTPEVIAKYAEIEQQNIIG